MMAQELVLRDVHVPVAPSLWPPAPGWWLLAAMLLLVTALATWLWLRRRRRLQGWKRLFDVASSRQPATAQIAAMSELLRRAARRVDRHADRLQGEAWLGFLQGKDRTDAFTGEPGRLLLQGGYQRDVDADSLAALTNMARVRFLELMAKRP